MALIATNFIARAPLFLLAAAETMVFLSAVYLAGLLSCGDLSTCGYDVGSMTSHVFIVTPIMFASLVAMGLYQFRQRMRFREVFLRLFVGISFASLVLFAFYSVMPIESLSQGFIPIAAIYAIVVLSILRFFFLRSVDQSIFRRKTLVLGSGPRAASIGSLRRRADRRGFELVGTVAEPYGSGFSSKELPLETNSSLLALARSHNADEIVIAMDDRRGVLPRGVTVPLGATVSQTN